MCTGCMGNADFLLTSGIVGAAGLRVTARRLLTGRRDPIVTETEAADFVASLTLGSADPGHDSARAEALSAGGAVSGPASVAPSPDRTRSPLPARAGRP